MTTLTIETSTNHGSVAVVQDGKTLFNEQFAADRSLGSLLFPCLQRALAAAPHLDKIAVGLGPGSYSGVRIAIAAAIGLEFSHQAEVVGIPSFLALDTPASQYLSIGDARRASFYFAEIANGECLSGPMLLDEAGLKAAITAQSTLPVYASSPVDAIPSAEIRFPSAERLALLAEQSRGITARGNLEPIYLRDPHITQPRKNAPQ